ncbi:MAG: hemoglobin [Candidatus Krumholzibacteriia bacterium]|jgi:hemoglobin
MSESLYERIGGKPAVQVVVTKMYEKVLDDDLLAPFFDGIDIDSLRNSQSAFVTMAFGGPRDYTGEDLRIAHAGLVKDGLSDKHFDAVAAHLKAAMEEMDVAGDLINEALAIVDSTRDHVLNR